MPSQPTPDLEHEIAALAYRFWEEEGCPADRAVQNWERAEREIHRQRGDSVADPLAPGGIPNDTGASGKMG